MVKQLPAKWNWFDKITGPNIWKEARKHYGLLEKELGKVVPELLSWCKEMGVFGWFPGNDFPWCGLFVAIVIKRAGWKVVDGFLGAINWLNFGIKVYRKSKGFINGRVACWMDIGIFTRPGGAHVTFLVAENKHAYLCWGGNQSNAVGLAWIAKDRCEGIVRPDYNEYVPVPLTMLTETGELSTNEA